ncbi:PRTRC system protein E [Flavobacterium sp. GSB-24]|uniref:PRTRC system protein E n=1 Tax=Flavobacterium sp. GSB-24 TaxID=2994319 RepID=UPI00248FCFF3|nr:PRTRC system protein E [Flavobacterium sp. GSB-24]BDU25206.1 hypothetical protein FLGSB24_19500 [Flavobacterium sp. GSB-24]
MDTNFFNQIAQLQIIGDLHLTIAKGAQNNLIVSVLIQNDACRDNAKNIIPPLNLRGTAEELDNGFFQTITTPIESASGLMVDMESFMKQIEETKKQSAIEKEKADSQKKQNEAKDKKFKDAMAKADELEKEGKFREAWIKVPEIAEFPQKAEEIRRRKTSLSDRFATPCLFGAMEEKPQPKSTEQINALYPAHEMEQEDEQEDEEE